MDKTVSAHVTLDRFNVITTDETLPKNENQQLDEYCLIDTLRQSCPSTQSSSTINQENPTQFAQPLAENEIDQRVVAAKSVVLEKKEAIKMPELCQMLINAHIELTAMLDLSAFLLMTKEEAQRQFEQWQQNT